jgi:RNA polymerase sigma-70 factor (ECF subfamily)
VPAIIDSTNDGPLIELALAGDATALQQLLLAYYQRLLDHITRQIPAGMAGKISGEDVLQQTYLQAFRSIESFDPRSAHSFYAWLKKIAEHVLIDAARREGREVAASEPIRKPSTEADDSSYAGLLSQIMDDDASPTTQMMAREALRALHVALASMQEDCREAIRLRYLEGRSRKEVADMMGRTESVVHHLCKKGRQYLRDELQRLSRFV